MANLFLENILLRIIHSQHSDLFLFSNLHGYSTVQVMDLIQLFCPCVLHVSITIPTYADHFDQHSLIIILFASAEMGEWVNGDVTHVV